MSTSANELVRRCCDGDARAWCEIWEAIERASASRITWILRRRGFDTSLTMDVLQELAIYLMQDEFRRLRNFKGTSDREFACFVRTIAMRFACRVVTKWNKEKEREFHLLEWSDVPDRHGATEPQMCAKLNELVAGLSKLEKEKLRILMLLHERKGDRSYSERTLRRWGNELRSKLEDLSRQDRAS